MTDYQTVVAHIGTFLAGIAAAYAYIRHALGWVPGAQADLQAEIAKIIGTLENRGASAAPTVPPSAVPTPLPPLTAPTVPATLPVIFMDGPVAKLRYPDGTIHNLAIS